MRKDTGHLTEFELLSATANFSAALNWQSQWVAVVYFKNLALVSFCSCHARWLVLCTNACWLGNRMPTWNNLINWYSLLQFFFLLYMSVLFFWMEFNYYYSIYYFGSFYCTINTHICIINIDITLMLYSVQYVKTISVRCHPLLLVSNISCPFNVKKFPARACLLPWFQKINGGKSSALRLMHWARWIGFLASNSCMYHFILSLLLFLLPTISHLICWNCSLLGTVSWNVFLQSLAQQDWDFPYNSPNNAGTWAATGTVINACDRQHNTRRHVKDERWAADFGTSLL